MRWYVRNIFPTASLLLDHSILYALVCEKELSHMGKNNGNPNLMCEKISSVACRLSSVKIHYSVNRNEVYVVFFSIKYRYIPIFY